MNPDVLATLADLDDGAALDEWADAMGETFVRQGEFFSRAVDGFLRRPLSESPQQP